jgi:hypothetical protein
VRNPFDKAVSNFYYTTGAKNPSGLVQRIKKQVRSSLRALSPRFLRFEFERWLRHGGPGMDRDKYTIDADICMDDFIFFEHLEGDIRRICERLGLPYNIERLSHFKTYFRTKTYSTCEHYMPAAVEIVADIFDREIEEFSYAFPDGDETAAPPPSARPWS